MDILSLNYVLIILFVIFQICDYATTIKVFNLGGGEGNKFLVWLMDKMKLDNYKMDRSISLFIIKIVVIVSFLFLSRFLIVIAPIPLAVILISLNLFYIFILGNNVTVIKQLKIKNGG